LSGINEVQEITGRSRRTVHNERDCLETVTCDSCQQACLEV